MVVRAGCIVTWSNQSFTGDVSSPRFIFFLSFNARVRTLRAQTKLPQGTERAFAPIIIILIILINNTTNAAHLDRAHSPFRPHTCARCFTSHLKAAAAAAAGRRGRTSTRWQTSCRRWVRVQIFPLGERLIPLYLSLTVKNRYPH